MLTFEVHEEFDGALSVDRSVYCFQRLPLCGCRRGSRYTAAVIRPPA